MQNQDQNKIYRIVKKLIPKSVISNKNKAKNWQYGYNDKYNVVVISKDGTIGDIYNINNLLVALPATPRLTSKEKKEQQVWNAKPIEKDLKKIQSIFHWHQTSPQFKAKWVDYIESEFDKREQGSWFLNNGTPTYITGTHYMYLQWTKIDVGNPDFREANRIFYIFWEACKADSRSFGMCYLKIRRSGLKLFQFQITIHSFLNLFKMVWINLKQN